SRSPFLSPLCVTVVACPTLTGEWRIRLPLGPLLLVAMPPDTHLPPQRESLPARRHRLPPTATRGPRSFGVLSFVCLVDGPLPIWHNVGMARLRPYDLVERVLARDPLELGGRFYTLPELLEVLGDRDAPATV